MNIPKADVTVIGAGHAGCEAALASARLGAETVLCTFCLDGIATMPCNPSIGGPGKTQLVRDIDALGGEMARAADFSALQYRMLNSKKGAAARALRAQTDHVLYRQYMRKTVLSCNNLTVIQGEVTEIKKTPAGFLITFQNGMELYSSKVILATGTFLRGKIFIGEFFQSAGRICEPASVALYSSLLRLGIPFMRLKTGTPARVSRKSLNFSGMEVQPSEKTDFRFTHYQYPDPENPLSCYLIRTSEKTHEIIRKNIHRSPLYRGAITGIGPRYCPSIEDKVMKFPDRTAHLIFVEPVSAENDEIYLQGMSTSLPEEIQYDFLTSVKGLENVKIIRPAYAVEYDCIFPSILTDTLEIKSVPGLYSAGQINGSSGYEEAAAQGLIAGINAAHSIIKKPIFTLSRNESMIGVLISDLTTLGPTEPYRLFPSTSEYMLYTRQDNADLRLMEKGHELGLLDQEKYQKYLQKMKWFENTREKLQTMQISQKDGKKVSGWQYLKTPGHKASDLIFDDQNSDNMIFLENECLYEGYIKKQESEREQLSKISNINIPPDLDFSSLGTLSLEARAQLKKIRPVRFSQIMGIPGITMYDILALKKRLETVS